jgi:hypothetical protein
VRAVCLRSTRLLFFGNLALLLAVSSILLFHKSPNVRALLVEYRDVLTTSLSSDRRVFAMPPTELLGRGFQTDSPATIAASRSRLARATASADYGRKDDVDLVKAIVLSFSRGGGARPTYDLTLSEKITEARLGHGFCSDHVEIFLALSELQGVFAREVQNEAHSFADFFSAAQGKWIWIDPLFAIMATDDKGRYLSSLEIRERRLSGLQVRYQFFGTADNSVRSEADSRFKRIYGDASLFRRYVLTYGNNVLTEMEQTGAMRLFPWEVRQLVLYGRGTKPGFVHLADSLADHAEIDVARRRRHGLALVAAYFTVSLAMYPLVTLARAIR